jgi:hypothetical protein
MHANLPTKLPTKLPISYMQFLFPKLFITVVFCLASAKFWGHILMTSTNQLTWRCHCLQQWMKQLFTWAHWYLVFIKHYLAHKGLARSTKYILNG